MTNQTATAPGTSRTHITPAELTSHEQEAERLADLCADYSHPDRAVAYKHYCDTLHRAMNGVVWTPERVRRLYPVLAEICEDIDEVEREEEEMQAARTAAQEEANRLARIMEDEETTPETREHVERHIAELASRVGVTLATPEVLLSALPAIVEAAQEQGIKLGALPSFDSPPDAPPAAA